MGSLTTQEKMDALDIVIDILVEHEKTLDALIERVEDILARLELLQTWR